MDIQRIKAIEEKAETRTGMPTWDDLQVLIDALNEGRSRFLVTEVQRFMLEEALRRLHLHNKGRLDYDGSPLHQDVQVALGQHGAEHGTHQAR